MPTARLLAVVLVVILCLSGIGWCATEEAETPGLVSHGTATVSPAQTIGKLLVVDGDAVVAGQVTGWLAVIHGNLVLKPTGRIYGGIFVLDGQVRDGAAAGLAPGFSVVLPPASPVIKLFVWLTILSTIAALFLAILGGWLIIRWLGSAVVYAQIRRHIPVSAERLTWLVAACGLAVSGFLLAVFSHLATETLFYHETDFVDQIVIWLVRYFASPALTKLMLAFTFLGSGYVSLTLALILLAGLFWRGRQAEGVSLLICLAGGGLLNFLLKNLFERARPDMFRLISETGYSFPSGHAMVALCFYGMLAYIFGRRLSRHYGRFMVLGVTAALIVAIGISRIYLGVHYPSDVLAGYIAGGTWLVFCITMLWWWEMRREN